MPGKPLDRLRCWAQLVGEVDEIPRHKVEIALWEQIARLAGSVFGGSGHKGRLQPALGRGEKIAVVRRHHHYRGRRKPESLRAAQIDLRPRFIGSRDLRSEDRVPGQTGALG